MGRSPPFAQLHRLDRWNRHHRLRDSTVELSVPLDVRAEAHRNPRGHDLDNPPQGVSPLWSSLNHLHEPARGSLIEGASLALVRSQGERLRIFALEPPRRFIQRLCCDVADSGHEGTDLDAQIPEQGATHGAKRDADRGFPRGRSLQNVSQILEVVVLETACEVRVARTRNSYRVWVRTAWLRL